MATTGAANTFVVNITELQNVITNAGGAAPNLSNAVAQIQEMVIYDTKEIKANILGSFNTGSIQVNDPFSNTTTVNQLIITGGSPGIGKYLTCQDSLGTAQWTTFAQPSDRDWKEDIKPIENAGAILEGLHGVRFKWKSGSSDVGVIAQDVFTVLPEAYIPGGEGRPARVEYHKIIPVLIETVKELEKRVNELESKNLHLEHPR
jgi:hypothetical protein